MFSQAIILKTKKSNMATIRKPDGKKGVGYQVQVRNKSGDMGIASFKSLTKVLLWAQSIKVQSVKVDTSLDLNIRNLHCQT